MPLFPNYSACTWCTTTLSTGPVLGGAYVCNITSLSASTVYQYRAYAVIDGVPYYGNILSGCTQATPTFAPSVSTGCVGYVGSTSMYNTGNSITNKGGLPIAEYGVLYTQIASYGSPTCLVYEAYPAKICKKSIFADIATGTTYFTNLMYALSSLTPNTLTYYRAFAKNSTGCGYGTIKIQQTDPPPVIAVTACICVASSWYNEQQGYICLDPPLASGQWAQLSINYNQTNYGVTYTDVARIRIYCKPNGVPYYSEITTAIDPDYYMCTDVSRFCGYGGGQIMINCGDEICFSNQVESTIGSCSSFCIHPYDSSSDISVSVHPDYCENCVVIT